MKYVSNTLLILIALFTLSGCFQQKTDLDNSPTSYWIEDKSGEMTFDEVLNRDLATDWDQGQDGYPNFGFTKSVVWLSLPFVNNRDLQSPMLLEIAFPLHDSIDFYLLDGTEVVASYQTGDKYPFAQRPLNHRNFLFPHTVAPHQQLRAIIRLQSSDTMYLPVKVWESNEFFTLDQHEVMLLGLFFGFLSIMMVYNLFLYFSTGHKNYLYYVGCTAAIIYLQLAQKGFGYQYLWPDNPFLNHIGIPLANYIAIVFSLFFIYKFLALNQQQHSKTVFTFKLLIGLAVQGIIWTGSILITHTVIIPYDILLLSTAVAGLISTLAVIILLINLAVRGHQSAQILSLAWLFFLAGSVLFALGRVGVPLPMLLTENAMLIGSTIEAALISLALATHIKTEREARMKAQDSLIALKEKTTEQLEGQVKERTQKLETAMQNLTLANHKLDNLSRMDSLTGLSNRRNFDQLFNETWFSCARSKKPLSLLMADIDHFKSINDTYGHLFGDQCLIRVADILNQQVKRPRDLAARFGGEEFIIMLPETDVEGATAIAERIRRGIEKLRMHHGGKEIKFTISIGAATIVPVPEANFIDFNEKADQALYWAKESGRNRVVAFENYRVGHESEVVCC